MQKENIKGEVTVSEEEKELALSFLKEISYDNGFFNRWYPESYNAKWINKIGSLAKKLFDMYPELLNDENIEEICSGEETEVDKKYGKLIGFNELNKELNNYFNSH